MKKFLMILAVVVAAVGCAGAQNRVETQRFAFNKGDFAKIRVNDDINVEYIANADDPSNPAAGRWDYTWTFYEDDLKGCDCIEVANNSLVSTYFISSAITLYNMRFAGQDLCVLMMTMMVEMIINWLKENATESEPAILTLDGAFKATATVENGKVVMGIVPDGEMKVLIKDDSAIQEK